jgi:capsule biosynthesis phosphatase
VDLDGTIACNKQIGEEYGDVKPIDGAVSALQELKSQGVYIVIHTARNMGTQNNNLGRVIANQAKIVIDWLDKYRIPYDELLFGKPNVDYFIDDKGLPFSNWESIKNKILKEKRDV